MSQILVTGATGQLGTIVVEELLKHVPATQISVLVRDEKKAEHLQSKGVKIKVGDYTNKSSLLQAFTGINKLLLISSNDFNDRFGQHKNTVDAAKQAGVKHIYYTGVTMKDINTSPLKDFLNEHYLTEAYIIDSGLAYTFLQNSLYADVIPMFVGANVLETGIYFAAGDGKVAFAVRKDLGEAAAILLASEGTQGKTYTLSATKAYSFADVATELSKLAGKTVGYTSPEPAAFEAMLNQFGLPPHIVSMSMGFAAGIKNNDFEATDATLETILGRPQTDLSSYLKATFFSQASA